MSSEFMDAMPHRCLKRIFTVTFLLAWAVSVFGRTNENPMIAFDPEGRAYLTRWAHAFGDDPAWSVKAFDHTDWETIDSQTFQTDRAGIHWYRARIRLSGPADSVRLLVFRIVRLASAFELYWDGRLIGRNGTLGSRKSDEIPGRVYFAIRVDDDVSSAGEHVIAIRASNFHGKRRYTRFYTVLSIEDVHHHGRTDELFGEVFYIGVFLTGAILGLALFLGGGRYRPYLLFAMICGATLVFSILHFILDYFNPSSVLLPVFGIARSQLYIIIEILIILFFLFNFDIPKKWIHVSVITSALMITRNLGLNSMLGMRIDLWFVVLHPLALLVYSAILRKAGSRIALAGFLVFIVPETVGLFGIPTSDFMNMITYVVFLLALILSISRRIQEQNRMQRMIERRSSRLEADLLKKSIQPHFLMNTLHTIQAWAKRNPENVSKLIQAFADELRIITRISAEKEIPLMQEIALCEAHLTLMGYRRIAEYRLVTDDLCGDALVPPLIFHTLIENGLTHAFQPTESGTFHLSSETKEGRVMYRLRNDGSKVEELAGRSRVDVEEGMGLRYVRARLEERYPGRWRLDYGTEDGWWEVILSIEA